MAQPHLDYRDLVKGLQREYLINSGHNSEGLDYLFVSNVSNVRKYTWGGWEITFESGYQHTISANDWQIMDFEWNTKTHELLMGFIPEPAE
jgi:hypothetical protein